MGRGLIHTVIDNTASGSKLRLVHAIAHNSQALPGSAIASAASLAWYDRTVTRLYLLAMTCRMTHVATWKSEYLACVSIAPRQTSAPGTDGQPTYTVGVSEVRCMSMCTLHWTMHWSPSMPGACAGVRTCITHLHAEGGCDGSPVSI